MRYCEVDFLTQLGVMEKVPLEFRVRDVYSHYFLTSILDLTSQEVYLSF